MANDYSKLSKEELLKVIEKLESRKKYGLIWDEKRTKEQFEKEAENALPVLKEVKSKAIKTDLSKPVNILIEGDNYHALSVLNYTHQGKIDVIYIDPPYNTGNKDFKYNDNYVDKEDAYRHSKWLSFMNKRLRLAKNLLSERGIIFISIDDNEFAQLKLMCDAIFGENCFITNIIWQSKTGASDAKTIDTITEYVYVYVKSAKGKAKFARNKFSYEKKRYRFKDEYEKDRGRYYPDNLDRGGLRYSDSLNYPIKCPDGTKTYPNGRTKFINDGWTWKWGKEKVKWGIGSGYIEFKRTKKKQSGWAVYYKNYMYADNEGNPTERSAPQKNIITDIKTGDGATVIKQLFGHQLFKYSKPVQIIKRILDYVDLDEEPIILDFMAGSGTTGHAILELNKEDNKNRKFILCTNDEELESNGNVIKHKICSDICYPRIKKAIKGYKSNKKERIEGVGGNLKYFKTSFVKRSINKDSLKVRITRECTEMLCLREGIFNEIKKTDDYRIFQHNDNIMGVYYSLERGELKSLKKDFDKKKCKKILYCFTLDPLGLDRKDFRDWKDVSLEPIPQKILDIYEGIYEY